MSRSPEARIRIRFLFEMFACKKINSTTFIDVCRCFDQSLVQTAEFFVRLMQTPECIKRESSRQWADTEVALLLACVVCRGVDALQHLFPHRTQQACYKKYQRVVQELEEAQMLSDVIHGSQNLSSTEVQTEDSTQMSDRHKRTHHTCKVLRMRIARAKRKAKTKERRLRAQNASLQKKVALLQRQLTFVDEEDDAFENANDVTDNDSVDETVAERVLGECAQLLNECPTTRRYTPFLLDVAHLLALTSPKGYRVLRQVMPLPGESTLWNHFASKKRETREFLTGEEQIQNRIIQLFQNQQGEPIACTVGIDAFALQSFCGSTIPDSPRSRKYTNAFLFVCVPLDPQYPVRTLHIHPKENGSYDKTIAGIFEILAENMKDKAKIWFKATDGDRFLAEEHDTFFKDVVAEHLHDFSHLIEKIYYLLSQGKTMPIADPLHFGKNIRGRLLDHDVCVVRNGRFTNAQRLRAVLDVGDALKDRSLLGRMRDCYVTKLFTLENVCILLEKNDYSSALLLLPYSCVYTVLYATNLSVQTRVFLTRVAYTAFVELLQEVQSMGSGSPGVKQRYTKGTRAVTIAERGYIKRMIHTCLAIAVSLIFGPNDMRLDAIGTHIVENMIGTARSMSNSPRYDAIISAFVNCENRKDLAADLGLKIHVPRRINSGGTKVNSLDDKGLCHPETWNPVDIVAMIMETARGFVRGPENGLSEFTESFRSFVDEIELHELTQPNSTANALIIERNRKFQGAGTSAPSDPNIEHQ